MKETKKEVFVARPKRMSGTEIRKKMEQSKEYREEIFERLLTHIRAGYSVDCFSELGTAAIEACCVKFPFEFVKEELVRAEREGKSGWEKIGRQQSTGQCLGNSRSWYYNMSHRYGWSDRVDARVEHAGSVAVEIVSYARNVKPLDVEEKS